MTDYERSYVARRPPSRKPARKRTEGNIANNIDKYLAELGMINIRTNAGAWQDDSGNWILGAKAGTSDKTCCTPHGLFLAIETKAPKRGQTVGQKEYQARVESLGATYIVAHSVAELRDGLCRAYGPQRVAAWEAEARARKQAKAELRDALMRKNGQKR